MCKDVTIKIVVSGSYILMGKCWVYGDVQHKDCCVWQLHIKLVLMLFCLANAVGSVGGSPSVHMNS